MSDAIVFVLHAPADEAAAIELATALHAQPVRLPDAAAVRFGGGACCVLLWSAHAAQLDPDALGAALGHDAASFILRRSAHIPAEFTARGLRVVESDGDVATDAAKLRSIIAVHAQGGPRAGKIRSVPRAAVTVAAETPVAKNRTLAVRSAVGLAATVAVAGVVAPVIGQRASATAGSETDATFDFGFTPVEPLEGITLARLAAVQPASMIVFAAAPENSPAPMPEANDMYGKAAPESLERGGVVVADESKGAKGLRLGEAL